MKLVSYLGPSTEFRVKVGEQSILVQQSNKVAAENVQIGQSVTLGIPPEWCLLFASDGRASGRNDERGLRNGLNRRKRGVPTRTREIYHVAYIS